jgi:hypothetical protein
MRCDFSFAKASSKATSFASAASFASFAADTNEATSSFSPFSRADQAVLLDRLQTAKDRLETAGQLP